MSMPPPQESRMPLAFEKMTPEQRIAAIKYKAKVQRLDAIPSRTNKLLGLAGWGSAILIVGWMSLYEDFGQDENVFTDLRKHYRKFMKSTFNLTPEERSILAFNSRGPPSIPRLNSDAFHALKTDTSENTAHSVLQLMAEDRSRIGKDPRASHKGSITTNAMSRRGQVGREFPPYPTYRPAHAWSRLQEYVDRR